MGNEEYTTTKPNVSDQNRSTLSQQANQAKEAAKDAVNEATTTVKQQAQQTVQGAQQAVSELAADAKQTATETFGEVKARAESAVDERKSQAADRLQGIAGALRETSNTLHGKQEDAFADYAAVAADQVDKLSGYLRNQNIGDLVQDVQTFARRQPELFLAGALAAGFMVGRFFKSSGAQQLRAMQNSGYYPRAQSNDMYGASQYNQSGASNYGSSYAMGGDRGQYSTAEYQRQSGASNYGSQSGAQYQRQGSTMDYLGQQNLPEQPYARQGQNDWSSSAGSASQTAPANQPANATQSRAEQNKSEQSQSDQQKSSQRQGGSGKNQTASSGSIVANAKEE